MIRRPPRSTPLYSSAASDVYKRQCLGLDVLDHALEVLPVDLAVLVGVELRDQRGRPLAAIHAVADVGVVQHLDQLVLVEARLVRLGVAVVTERLLEVAAELGVDEPAELRRQLGLVRVAVVRELRGGLGAVVGEPGRGNRGSLTTDKLLLRRLRLFLLRRFLDGGRELDLFLQRLVLHALRLAEAAQKLGFSLWYFVIKSRRYSASSMTCSSSVARDT